MDAIRLRQTREALDYDKRMNALAFTLDKRYVAMLNEEGAQPTSQLDEGILNMSSEGVQALLVLLEKKRAELSIMIQPGIKVTARDYKAALSEVCPAANDCSMESIDTVPSNRPSGPTTKA